MANDPPSELHKISNEYKGLLVELYKENQKFLNNLILGASTLALPFLFEKIPSAPSGMEAWLLIFALGMFVTTICIQLYTLKCARDGCDHTLAETDEGPKKGLKLFKRAKKWDLWRERAFIAGIVSIFFSLLTSIVTKETYTVTTRDTTTVIKKDTNMKNEKRDTAFERSFTPPNAQIQQNQEPSGTTPQENQEQTTSHEETTGD